MPATKVTGREKILQLAECYDEELRMGLTRSTVGTLSDKSEAVATGCNEVFDC